MKTTYEVRFKLQLLYYKNMLCVFRLYVDRSRGTVACMTTPHGVCFLVIGHDHDRTDY